MSFEATGRLSLSACVLALVTVGCSPQQQAAVDLESMPVQPDAPMAAAHPSYGVGTAIVGDYTLNGEVVRVTSTIVEKTDVDGRTVDRLEHSSPLADPGAPCDGETHTLWDAKTANWMGCMAGDRLLAGNEPHGGRYAWPLQVGNTWRWNYRWVDHTLQPDWSGPGWADYEVLAYEEVTVPAGTFMAFRVATTKTSAGTWFETNWYAPDAGLTVKGAWGRTSRDGYGGVERAWELVSLDAR